MMMVMSTQNLDMLNAKVSFEADFITPDTNLGAIFVAHLIDRFLAEEVTIFRSGDAARVVASDVFSPEFPDEKHWVISEDSDINDEWGSGFRLQTGPMHFLLGAPIALMNITKFIRENGVTDTSCRFRVSYFIDGLVNLPLLKFLFLLDETKWIEEIEKFGPFMRKSHMEHLAACLHTNLYWQDDARWFREAHRDIEAGPEYAIDFSNLHADRVDIDIIQGPHWEHRTNLIGHLLSETSDALRESFNADHATYSARARKFYDYHTAKRHAQANYRPPT